MLHHAQPTQHFISWHWQLLGQSWTNIQCQCTGKIALSVQSGPWPVSSGTASCVGSDRGSLSIKPFHAPPAPSAPSPCYPRQLPVTDHPPGSHQQTPGSRRTQEHYSTPEAQCPIKHRFHTGIHTWPQIKFGITVPFQNGGCLVSPASWRQRGRFGGLYGRARNRAEQCCAGAD